jgi:zinc D-Ala-D-Ala carboxypeptidase
MTTDVRRLTEHFTLDELTVSEVGARQGLDNTPPPLMLPVLRTTALGLELVRKKALGDHPIIVTSGYRSPLVNQAVGGSKRSQHLRGEAADFICPGFGTPLDVCRRIIEVDSIPFDQLIWEHTWVHISFVQDGARRSVLTLLPNGKYAPGLVRVL